MLNRKILSRFYPLVLILIVFIVWKCRKAESESVTMVELSGTTMGSITYSIKYFSESGNNYQAEVDSLLKVWNMSLSTYIPKSEISRFNSGADCFEYESKYFYPVVKTAEEVYEKTNGAFDPTVGPIVNAWGFGPDKSMAPDSATVDSLLVLVGYDKIHFDENKVCKDIPGMKLDFSAIAKGYAVDVVADFLIEKGAKSLLVEIGGEVICKGKKINGDPWRMAIEDPTVEIYDRKILAVANLVDRAVATSGNYRNYYVKDGKKYTHTINPSTGYPTSHLLLSASVFADNCMKADAYATAFMVLGTEKAKEILAKDSTLDAFLIYSGEHGELETYASPGIKSAIEILPMEDQGENNVQISN
jgi:FAD:protein FMN transferase